MTPHAALKKALKLAGGQVQLAEILGVGQPTVSSWVNRGKRISPNYALKCHLALDGQVSAHDLRPDIYPRRTVTISG